MHLRNFIFDLDCTLAGTLDLIVAGLNASLGRRLEREFTGADVASFFGQCEVRIIEDSLPGRDWEQCVAEYNRFCAAHHDEYITVFNGLQPLVRALHEAGCGIGVVTGKGRGATTVDLEFLDYAPYMPVVVTGEDVVCHKPHPEGLLSAIAQLGGRPEETIYIGDSPGDLHASRAAGTWFGAALWGSVHKEELLAAEPDFVFPTVANLADWLAHVPLCSPV